MTLSGQLHAALFWHNHLNQRAAHALTGLNRAVGALRAAVRLAQLSPAAAAHHRLSKKNTTAVSHRRANTAGGARYSEVVRVTSGNTGRRTAGEGGAHDVFARERENPHDVCLAGLQERLHGEGMH
jgi:hypothetical protein